MVACYISLSTWRFHITYVKSFFYLYISIPYPIMHINILSILKNATKDLMRVSM